MIVETAGGAVALGTLALGTYYCNAPLFGPVTGHGPRRGRELYLSFDDGPNPTATESILDTLAREGVPATFFMVGEHVRRYSDIARKVGAAAHEIGNHTDTHVKLHVRGPARIRAELETAHRTITETTGRTPRTFRAPHGFRNPFVAVVTKRMGYRVFGWSFGVWDHQPIGAEEIRRRVRVRSKPGAIILLHDGDGYDPVGNRRQTAEALPGIIRDARDAGYVFRSLGALLPGSDALTTR